MRLHRWFRGSVVILAALALAGCSSAGAGGCPRIATSGNGLDGLIWSAGMATTVALTSGCLFP